MSAKKNNYAVFILPPQMLVFHKPTIDYIITHAADPAMLANLISQIIPKQKYSKADLKAFKKRTDPWKMVRKMEDIMKSSGF